jgi:glucose/arabinose dehydrogenase
MRVIRAGLCLASLALGASVALAQRAVPVGTTGTPVAPPGFDQPLGDGPFTYHTGEGQDIRVTVLARLPWPYGIAFLPDGDLLVTQRGGTLARISKATGVVQPVPGGPVAAPIQGSGTHGYMRIALHPQFAQNGYVYIAYLKPAQGEGLRPVAAVARAKYANGRLSGTQDVWVGEKVAGPTSVALTPDGKLWIGTTEGGQAQDPMRLGGKVLRLNDDGTVPQDNPHVGKDGYRPEIYSMGHRTALGLTVNPTTRGVFMAEMGPNGGDEVNLIKPGANYGWPLVSLGRTYPGPWQAKSNEPTHHDYELPLVYWTPSISVSGLSFYNGDAFPKWKGDLFVGGLRYGEIPGTGRIDRVVLNEKFEEMRRESLLVDLHQRIRDVQAGPDGLIYAATDQEQGAILRIEPAK